MVRVRVRVGVFHRDLVCSRGLLKFCSVIFRAGVKVIATMFQRKLVCSTGFLKFLFRCKGF